MIKKAILAALGLLIIYSIFVIRFSPHWWHASQHQWQENVVKAQNYLYDDSDTIQNVIIGSSLSCRLITDNLPHTYNLSLGGQGIFDGLNIIYHKTQLPKNVFIEMNFVLRPENNDFLSSLYSPIMYYPRKYIPSLREDKQPLAILGFALVVTISRFNSILFSRQRNYKKDNVKSLKNENNSLFTKMISSQVVNYTEETSEEILDETFNKLREYLTEFESKGVNIVFFEMPVNKQLENLKKPVIIREAFKKYFPASKYTYTSLPKSFECSTTDGLHLNFNEAFRYTEYLKTENINCFR